MFITKTAVDRKNRGKIDWLNQKRDTRMGKRDKIDMIKEYVWDNHFRQDGVIGIRFTFLPEITKNHDEIYKMKHTGHY